MHCRHRCRLPAAWHRRTAPVNPPAGSSPAKAIIPATVVEAQPQLRCEDEAVAEGGQAVAELDLQPLVLQVIVTVAVAVGCQPLQGGAVQQGGHAAVPLIQPSVDVFFGAYVAKCRD